MLFIEKRLQRGFNLGDLFVAEIALDPADDDLFGETIEGGHAVGLGCFEAKAAVGTSGIGAVFSVDGVVNREDDAVSGVAFEVGDAPGKGGAHDM